ncbi:MAG: hypothetical protein HUJ54_01715 [Erysipelotrichaceae bacterium]|nr:hypothetical protein [Erysipelotrichaceae bacterium]
MSDALFWVIAAIIGVIGGFTGYTNWKQYKASREAKEVFLKNHKNAEVIQLSKGRIWLFAGLAVVCIALVIILGFVPMPNMTDNTRWSQLVVYAGLGVFCVAMIPECVMSSTIVASPDGFMYGDYYFRYKHVQGIIHSGNVFKSDKIILTGNKEEIIPKGVAKWAEERFFEWKERRKEAKRKGRNR